MDNSINFPKKSRGPPRNSWRQKDDKRQGPHWGPAVLQRPADLTLIWRFVIGAYQLTLMFCMERKILQ